MCGLSLSQRSWLAASGVSLATGREQPRRNFSWNQVGRFWMILPTLSSWRGWLKALQSFTWLNHWDETANQLISQSMTLVFGGLQSRKHGCVDECVCVCVFILSTQNYTGVQQDYTKSPAEYSCTIGLERRTLGKWMAAHYLPQINSDQGWSYFRYHLIKSAIQDYF